MTSDLYPWRIDAKGLVHIRTWVGRGVVTHCGHFVGEYTDKPVTCLACIVIEAQRVR